MTTFRIFLNPEGLPVAVWSRWANEPELARRGYRYKATVEARTATQAVHAYLARSTGA